MDVDEGRADFEVIRARYYKQVTRCVEGGGTDFTTLDSAVTDLLRMCSMIRGGRLWHEAMAVYGPPPFPRNADTRFSVLGRGDLAKPSGIATPDRHPFN